MAILLYISIILAHLGDTIASPADTVAAVVQSNTATIEATVEPADASTEEPESEPESIIDNVERPAKPAIEVLPAPVRLTPQLITGSDDDATIAVSVAQQATGSNERAVTADESTVAADESEPSDSTAPPSLLDGPFLLPLDTLPTGDSITAFEQFLPVDNGGDTGVSGVPVAHSIAADNVVALLLLACLLFSAAVVTRLRRFLSRQTREFFRYRHDNAPLTETTEEYRTQVFFVIQTALLAAMMYLFLVIFPDGHLERGTYAALALCFAAFIALFAVQAVVYWFTAWVFFSRTATARWMKSFLLLRGVEGLFLLPAVLLYAYFRAGAAAATTYIAVIVIMFRLFALYRQNIIFFRPTGAYLQNFLYFCALEVVPLAALSGLLRKVTGFLMITF